MTTPPTSAGIRMLASASALFAAAFAAQGAQDDNVIARVIVTAERRPEDIQTVPLSVAALSRDDLQSLALRNAVDLATAVPGLRFDQQGIGATPFIRGVGATSGAIGHETAVSVYVDGVYIAEATAAVFGLADVSRVEVLKGPQGTLFGRNATGGVIQVETREPEPEAAAELQLQVASHATTKGSLYATTGIGETAAASLSLHRLQQTRGWGTDLQTGAPTFRHREIGGRTKLAWQPGAATRLVLAASHFERRGEDGLGFHIVPGSVGADGATVYSGHYNTQADPQDRARFQHTVASAHFEQELAAFRLVNILSWQRLHGFFDLDQDATPVRIVQAPISQSGHTITEELQALSHPDAQLAWIVGVYYLNDRAAYDPFALEGAASLPFSSVQIRSRQRSQSYAVYGQTTAHLTPLVDLTIGGRYTRDERDIVGATTGVLGAQSTTLARAQQNAQWKRPTWRVALTRDLATDAMAYASWDRGFKSGGYNLLTYAADPVHPEGLDAYQAGVKSDWLQHRLRVNLAGFLYRYRNIQVEEIVAGATLVMNAAAARMRGLELDLEYTPSRSLRLGAGLALLHGRYTDFKNAPINVPTRDDSGALIGGNTVLSGDATGSHTVRSPELSMTLHGRYSVPTQFGEFGFNAAYFRDSGFVWDPDNRLRERARGFVNAAIDWTAPGEALSLRAAASNLTDTESCLYATATGLGDLCSPRAPRVLSLEVSMKF